jgi:cytochrome b involved in lipid metabolism
MKLLEFFFLKGGNNKSKYFTKEEVKKHNTVDDGMLIVNGFVYKIPEKWITIDHPGGNVISKYLGKDATNVFNKVHQSKGENPFNILDSFKVGKLK